MSIAELGSLGELIAALATVATLGYLAYQIRVNTRHTRAYNQREFIDSIMSDHYAMSQLPIVRKGLTEFGDLSPAEQFQFNGIILQQAGKCESTMRLYRAGLVEDHLYEAHRSWILSWLTTTGGRQWWSLAKSSFSADTSKMLDDAIENGTELPPPVTESMPFYGLSADERGST